VNNIDEWKAGSGLVQPDEDGLLFLGFYTDNQQGQGLYLDDFSIDAWGPVRVNSPGVDNEPRIYYSSGSLYIKPVDQDAYMELTIYNQLGQVVYHGSANGELEIPINQYTDSGLYIINLKTGERIVSRKIMVR
jgi:hypothetical protein